MRYALRHRATGTFLVVAHSPTLHVSELMAVKDLTPDPASLWWTITSYESYGVIQHEKTGLLLGGNMGTHVRNLYAPPETSYPGLLFDASTNKTMWVLPLDWDPMRPCILTLTHTLTHGTLRVETDQLDTDLKPHWYVRLRDGDVDANAEWDLIPDTVPDDPPPSNETKSASCSSCSSGNAWTSAFVVVLAGLGGWAWWSLRFA